MAAQARPTGAAYFGKSVTTIDFQTAMEQANGRSLKDFFSKRVYLEK